MTPDIVHLLMLRENTKILVTQCAKSRETQTRRKLRETWDPRVKSPLTHALLIVQAAFW